VKRSGAAVLALRGPLSIELLIAQGCRPLSRHEYTVAALAPGARNVVVSVADAATGAALPPVEALRRDLSEPLQPINGERDL
jgi:small ligand-binding sensory domain FIST